MSEQNSILSTQEPPKVETAEQPKDTADVFYDKKPAESTPTEQSKDAAAESKPDAKKPEDEFVLTLPEEAALDESNVKEFTEYAKQKGISKELAQEILNRENTSVLSFQKAQETKLETEIKEWANQARVDKEIGGEKFKESVELAKRVIDRWGTPEFKAALDRGLGNHPEAIRVFSRIGKELLADDKLVTGGPSSKNEVPVEDLFYKK